MEQSQSKSSQKKANRILYMVIAGVLCVGMAIVGVVAFQPDTPALNNTNDQTVNQPVDNTPQPDTNTLPTFSAPLKGNLAKKHDLDTPVYSATMQEYRTHAGIDITCEVGAGVYAVADGTVKDVYCDPLMGWCVQVSHNGGAVSTYANLAQDMAEGITKGSTVKAGQLLGAVGESTLLELADEPHLHFEMMVSGVLVDPLDYISQASQQVSFGVSEVYED